MPKSLSVVLVVLVCITSASGPASSQAPGPRPELSGTLNLLCTPQIVWCEGMKAEFQKVYPKVTVEFVRLSSGEALTRLRTRKPTRSSISGGAGRLIRSSPPKRKVYWKLTTRRIWQTSSIPSS